MRIQFSCQLEDFVETQFRFMARSGTLRASFWRSLFNNAFLCALLALAVTAFVFEDWSDAWKLINATVGAALGIVLHLMTFRGELRKQFIKAWHGTSGGNEHLSCQVELSDDGICLTHQNTQSTYEWKEVEEITEGPSSIDIFMRRGGCGMAIHNRVFSSPHEKAKFVEIVESNSSARITRL